METMFVKPAEGVRCKDPVTFELMPAQGRTVPRIGYWLKRLKKGEVILAEKSAPKIKEQKSKNKKHKTNRTSEGDS